MKVTLKLIKPAKRKGGDRYEVDISGEISPLSIYFPQTISRVDGEPKKEITITID